MARPLLSDSLWGLIRPLLPPHPPRPKGGRPPVDDRKALTGILFVLKTGIPWEYLPQELGCGCGMTCWRRLYDWWRVGVWQKSTPCSSVNYVCANESTSRAFSSIPAMSVRSVAERKLSPGQQIGENSAAGYLCSPMPEVCPLSCVWFPPTAMTLRKRFHCWTRFRRWPANEVGRVAGRSVLKVTGALIARRTAAPYAVATSSRSLPGGERALGLVWASFAGSLNGRIAG